MKRTWRKAVSMGMALLLTLSVVAAGSGSSPVLRESVQVEMTVGAKAQQAATVEEAVEELTRVPQQMEAPAPEGKNGFGLSKRKRRPGQHGLPWRLPLLPHDHPAWNRAVPCVSA